MFAIINRLQSENTKQKSELLSAQQKIATYEDLHGNEQDAQLSKQAEIIEGQSNAITFEELTAGPPVDDYFAPDSVI